ncbi:hypothetical protein HMPREF1624_03260 [Sporothrix schenckii ATCC 58251]|uniref:RING-type domain-containing protein n=1 Tax=Sporothrix schenckii (strain ATCC 58251 / de Perez 2211183) TaxID=1391915 RepID=U7PWA0_SPOS1|nr:hypothetical protein HMPREF1624_03260 [Sporothrix schenckii ATCC 58251]
MGSPAPAMDLEKELTCSICTDLLYQPLTLLDCLHTFCGACLKEWFGWQALAAETSPNPPAPGAPIFTCPSCRDAVRSTKHNATVVTLLDMLIATQPDKRKPDDEKAEMDSKYRPGDNVFPKVHLPKRSAEQQRLDAAERRLIDEVREISRQEAVAAAAAAGGDGNNAAHEARRRQRRAALASTNTGSGAESASDEDGRLAVSGSGDRRRRRRSASRNPTAPAEEHLPPIMGHQSSLRSLISGSQNGPGGYSTALDIEREIEAFARQIQEEGILDGLDLDNIDLTNDDELSRRIAEAYQRRQRGRARHESGRHDGSRHEGSGRREGSRQDASRPESNRHRASSAVSHRSQVSVSSATAPGPSAASQPERTSGRPTLSVSSALAGRPPSSSSRPSSRHRSQSQSSHRSRSSTGGARPQSAVLADGVTPVPLAIPTTSVSRPPISNSASHHLEVRDDSRHHHQRRRTASEGRSSTLPATHSDLGVNRPMAQSQNDLPLRPAELQGDAVVVAELPSTPPPAPASASRLSTRSTDARSASFPTPSRSSSSSSSSRRSNNDSPTAVSFQARALAMGLPGPGGAQQPKQHSSWPATAAGSAAEGGQTRAKRATATSAADPSASSSTANVNPGPAALTTVQNTTPPPVATANFALSPVTIDTYELSALSSPESSLPRQQLHQQQLQQQQQPGHRRQGSTFFSEPDISCARCNRRHIEYDLHYNCSICSMGNWNICLDCYRAGKGCQHWFGFGFSAWPKWEKKAAQWRAENAAAISATGGATFPQPHMLTANRYLMPRVVPGGAEGRRTLTSEDPQDRLQSGVFCERCRAWANSCYWRCEVCNYGDWGFCNNCVNQGFACTHPLLPLTHQPLPAATTSSQPSQAQGQDQQPHLLPSPPPRPHASALYQLPAEPSADVTISAPRIGSFRALTFTTTCDICRKAIPPSRARFHCYSCTSTVVPDTHPGDYDVCQECYGALLQKRPTVLAPENGPNGWRRCPSGGHRMVVVAFREDGKNGGMPRRVVLEDLVGGFRLETGEASSAASGMDVESWYVWYKEEKHFERLVSRDVRMSAPSTAPSAVITTAAAAAASPATPKSAPFPPLGGVGRTAVARWAWYPEQSGGGDGDATAANDELLFPRQAEIREIEDVNGEWYHGVYMGRKGLFPSGFVTFLGE